MPKTVLATGQSTLSKRKTKYRSSWAVLTAIRGIDNEQADWEQAGNVAAMTVI